MNVIPFPHKMRAKERDVIDLNDTEAMQRLQILQALTDLSQGIVALEVASKDDPQAFWPFAKTLIELGATLENLGTKLNTSQPS